MNSSNRNSNKSWPPLIVAKHVPRLVKWRDFLLTLTMWGFFAVLLDIELELFVHDYLEQLSFGAFESIAKWPLYVERLLPFLLTSATLIGGLIIFSLRTMRRRSSALLLPQPAPLETADQARRAILDEAELIAARDQRIVIVHIDDNGRHRIEALHAR